MSNLLSITPLHQIQSRSGAGHKFQHRICGAGRLRGLKTSDNLVINLICLFLSGCASRMLSAVETAHSDPTVCLNWLLKNIKEPYLFRNPQLARSAILTPTSIVPWLHQGPSHVVQTFVPHLSRMKSSVNGASSSQITDNSHIQNSRELNAHTPHPKTKCTNHVSS